MHKQTAIRGESFALEGLEDRQLLSGTLPWGAYPLQIGQDQAYANFPYLSGAGQTVAIIDQGVDYNHVMLGGGIGDGFKVVAGANFGDGSPTDPMDTEGHGTGVGGIIAANPYTYNGLYFQGIAEHANIVALRETNSDEVKAALDWVIANHTKYNITVINMTDFVGAGFSPTVYQPELKRLYQAGIFMVTPVGNGGTQTPISLPASSPYVYGAGAVDLNDVVWQANRQIGTQLGSQLDVVSPGVNVTTTAYDVVHQRATYVDFATGTSFAAPHVAGVALLLKQLYPDITPAQIISIIRDSGTPVVAQDGNTYPRLNVNAAVTLAFEELGQGNYSRKHAAALTFNGAAATVTNQKLLIGHDGYYSFTVTGSPVVSISLQYTGTSAAPTQELLDSNGNLITQISGTFSQQLSAGTYYVHLTSPQSLEGTFGLTVSEATPAATPRRRRKKRRRPAAAAAVKPAVTITPSLTARIAVASAGINATLFAGDNDVLTASRSGDPQLAGLFAAR